MKYALIRTYELLIKGTIMPNNVKQIRNRATGTFLPARVQQVAKHVGKTVTGQCQTRRGTGTATLISPDIVLVSAHTIRRGLPTHVQFSARDSFFDQGIAYDVDEQVSNDSDTARSLGIHCGLHGDFALLRLKPKNGQFPGNQFGYSTIDKRNIPKDADIYFIGHSSGSHQKVSRDSLCPSIPLDDALSSRQISRQSLVGLPYFKGNTQAMIQSVVNTTTRNATTRTVTLSSPSGKPSRIKPDASGYVKFRPYVKEDGYMLTTHSVRDGGSGGVYTLKDGTIIGIHCGKVLHPETGTPVNLVYFPWGNAELNFSFVHCQGRKKQKPRSKKVASPIDEVGREFTTQQIHSERDTLIKDIRENPALKKKLFDLCKSIPELKDKGPKSSRDLHFDWDSLIDRFLEHKQKDYLDRYDALLSKTETNTKPVLLGRQAEVDTTSRKSKYSAFYTLDETKWCWGINLAFIEGIAKTEQPVILKTQLPDDIVNHLKTARSNGQRFLKKVAHLGNNTKITLNELLHDNDDKPTFTGYALEIACFLDLGYQLTSTTSPSGNLTLRLSPPTKPDKKLKISSEVNQYGKIFKPTLL